MIEKTKYTLPFSATIMSLVGEEIITSFLEKLEFEETQHFLLIENPGVRLIPIDKIVGKVTGIRHENGSYFADVEIYKTDYTAFVKDIIQRQPIRVSWRIDMHIEPENHPFSRYCYFFGHKKFRIREIKKVYCFFLEYFEEPRTIFGA